VVEHGSNYLEFIAFYAIDLIIYFYVKTVYALVRTYKCHILKLCSIRYV